MAGKNKLERAFRLWWDDLGTGAGTARDLSGDLIPGTVKGGGLVFDPVNLTGVSNTVRNYLAGHAESEVSAQFWMNDTATTGAFTVLTGSDGGFGTLTLQWGSSGAAPTTGDPEWEGEYVLLTCDHVLVNGANALQAMWKPQAGQSAPAWGTVT